jgi:uncharacterized protein YjbJ (UPF0337 family)
MSDDLGQEGIKHTVEGTVSGGVGHLKDAAGGLTGDAGLQAEGKTDQLKGKAERMLGEAEVKASEIAHSIKHSVEGAATEIAGRVKDAFGGLTGHPGTQAEGKVDELEGKAERTLGENE